MTNVDNTIEAKSYRKFFENNAMSCAEAGIILATNVKKSVIKHWKEM